MQKRNRYLHSLWCKQHHIQKQAKEAIEEIRSYLREYGNISEIEGDENIFGLYLDEQDYGVASPYSQIELFPTGEIVITLFDEHTIYEEDFTPNHINDLITIIQGKYGKYSK
ncbi:MAG: hypothetical protein LBQ74_20135 [Prevotella sp.]|jgi:hypothetical protein|nr:hypothetical protein [Prevotella sp.]